MARRKRTSKARPVAARPLPGAQWDDAKTPIDLRMGLAFFLLLEIGTYTVLATTKTPWFGEPKLALWRNLALAASGVVAAGIVGIWLAGSRSKRAVWPIALAIVWLIVLTARQVPFFFIAMGSAPILLTLYVGQLAFGLMVLAAANERR